MTEITLQALLATILTVISPLCCLQAGQDSTIRGGEQVRLVDWEELKYPPLARQARITGVVVLQVKLDGEGKVVESTAISGNKALIPDCLANVKKWRFQTSSQKSVVVVYNFRISDGVCHPSSNGSHFSLWPPNFASIATCEEPVQP